MNIQIINVSKENKQGLKSTYVMLEVTYKDLGTGKVGNKKIMSFSNKAVFETLSNAANGNQFEVKAEKKGDFWEWVNVSPLTGGSAQNAGSGGTYQKQSSAGNAVQSKTWETAEERAQRQVYIIRQSSLSNAIATLTAGAKAPPKSGDIISLAREYENYVFGTAVDTVLQQDDSKIPAFPDDDIPF